MEEENPEVDETYVFYKSKEGYTKEDDLFEDDAYNWAGYDMGGFEMMGFTSGYEFVIVPPSYWLQEELLRIEEDRKELTIRENLIKKSLGME